jgi:hypothetical protein
MFRKLAECACMKLHHAMQMADVNYMKDGFYDFHKLLLYLFFCSTLLKVCYFQISKDWLVCL